MTNKITKEEFFKSINIIIKNKNEINETSIKYRIEEYDFWFGLLLLPFTIGGTFSILNMINIPEDYSKVFFVISLFISMFFGSFLSSKISLFISDKILKNNSRRASYSLFSLMLGRHKKDFSNYKKNIKQFKKIIDKNNLPKNTINFFKKISYKYLLNCYNSSYGNEEKYTTSYNIIEELIREYENQNSKEILMKTLAEYIIHNYDENNPLIKNLIKETEEYYIEENNKLEKKRILMEASGLALEKENVSINKDIKEKLENNKKALKVLNI